MQKNILILIVLTVSSIFLSKPVFSQTQPLDDLKRSIKDIERTTRQDSYKTMELQKDYQLSPQKIKPITQDMTLGGPISTEGYRRKNLLFRS